MQQPIYRRLVRKRRWGDAYTRHCICYNCGAPVFPLPLRVNPDVRILRAYARGMTHINRHTGKLKHYAILFCPACADPEDVRDYVQFEIIPVHDAALHTAHLAAAVDQARHTSRL
jgi:hypothetical protein